MRMGVRVSTALFVAGGGALRDSEESAPTSIDPVRSDAAIILAAIHQAVIATDLSGRITYWNPFAEALYGWSAAETVGRNILDVTPTEVSRETAGAILQRLKLGETWAGEFWVRDKAGRPFLAHVTNSPITDATGNLVGVLGTSIAAEKRYDEQLALINRELKHHIKNLFAVASAVVSQSLKQGMALTEMRAAITGRLRAIASAQDMVSTRSDKGADLSALVDALVVPFAPAPDRLRVSGRTVMLPTDDATPFALILHELATNALKHGAWASDQGRATLTWDVETNGHLKFRWREDVEIPAPQSPRIGFGTALMQRGLSRGKVVHTLTTAGLDCLIDLPLGPD
jgi:PAS domain S-box-containing protein